MNNSLARLDLSQVFCDVDDFYQVLNRVGEAIPKLPYDGEAKSYPSKLSISDEHRDCLSWFRVSDI